MKKSVVLLMASLAVLAACGQQSHSGKAGSNQSVQSKAKDKSVTKSYQLNQKVQGLDQTMTLTVTYAGKKYEKVNIAISQNLPEEAKSALAGQDLSSLQEEVSKSFKQSSGVDKLEQVKGIQVNVKVTEKGTVDIDFVIDPTNLDYDTASKVPTYGPIFSQMKSQTPEEFI
jgi:lipoprotein